MGDNNTGAPLTDEERAAIRARCNAGLSLFRPIPEEEGLAWQLPLVVGSIVGDLDEGEPSDIGIEDSDNSPIAMFEDGGNEVRALATLMAAAPVDVPRLLATIAERDAAIERIRLDHADALVLLNGERERFERQAEAAEQRALEAEAAAGALREIVETHLRCDWCGKPATALYDSQGEGTYWLCDADDEDHRNYCGVEKVRLATGAGKLGGAVIAVARAESAKHLATAIGANFTQCGCDVCAAVRALDGAR